MGMFSNLRIGKFSQWLAPGYGCCYRCRTSWAFVEGHSTPWLRRDSDVGAFKLNGDKSDVSTGAFPLCEKCWSELAPADRLPFYRRLLDDWSGYMQYAAPDRAWAVIERSVLLEDPARTAYRIFTDDDGNQVLTSSCVKTGPNDPGPYYCP